MVYEHGVNDMYYGWASENKWNKKIYQEWCNMLKRCYNENTHKNQPSYVGCTVCERWLILSNFVEDVPKIDGFDKERILNGELELDKDKKNDTNNKGYYLEYCTWLPRPENHGLAMKGKHHTEESKQKMKENNTKTWEGKFSSEHNRSKNVAQYDKNTQELIKIWDSMAEVERELGISYQNISKCCRGKRKSAGGFIWKYVEE